MHAWAAESAAARRQRSRLAQDLVPGYARNQSAYSLFSPLPRRSYLLDPVIRRATQVEPDGAVLIFDEAHNIEDMARCVLSAAPD